MKSGLLTKVMSVILVLLCLFITGCGKNKGASGVIWDGEEFYDAVGILEATGIDMRYPEGASGLSFTVISGDLAQIKFSYQSVTYSFRASEVKSGLGLHGVYGEFINGRKADINGVRVTLRNSDGEGTLAEWSDKGVNYSLFAEGDINDADISAVLKLLV